jgi:hypothetical protein
MARDNQGRDSMPAAAAEPTGLPPAGLLALVSLPYCARSRAIWSPDGPSAEQTTLNDLYAILDDKGLSSAMTAAGQIKI